ncbi:hypothetical protein BGP_6221 [Beggiatoa sp. PS]|nr:hypothetical protein BGP_6221 [Beggiatoa sp. PS]
MDCKFQLPSLAIPVQTLVSSRNSIQVSIAFIGDTGSNSGESQSKGVSMFQLPSLAIPVQTGFLFERRGFRFNCLHWRYRFKLVLDSKR